MAAKSIAQTQREVAANDPPIEVNQIWVAYLNRKIFRKLRILALMPEPNGYAEDGKAWIVEEQLDSTHGKNMNHKRIAVTPEFNLRFIFRPKGTYDGG